ncbi:hypothetical protein Leryth_009733 [Lithospermum erythrorhizon]|nr:hypothetical protein Leryth_009733 [Lithospermum erythrorhizon]
MSERNIVSWTAMINGFAQECDVDMCLHLYKQMRNLSVNANEFTFTSFLIACTGSGCLGQGRSVHCQTIRTGFDSYVHVGNALISMYCKCGEVGGAMSLFRSLNRKDLVSWNSIIAGYAHHGMAIEAIQLFEEMKQQDLVPDSITFLALLSSCRHAGFLNHAQVYLDSMDRYGVTPGLNHYSCMVDLLGRAGLIEEARNFIMKMPVTPNPIIWGSLLSSSKLHGYVDVGIEAADNRLLLEPWCSATHLQLANLYASAGYRDEAAKVRKLMKENGLKTDPGCSWVEIKNTIHLFRAEDRSNSCVLHMVDLLATLISHMRVVDNFTENFEVEL